MTTIPSRCCRLKNRPRDIETEYLAASPSAESEATVHDDRLPDNVVSHWRSQKEGGASHVGWSTEPATRNSLERLTQASRVLSRDLRHLGIHETRGNSVHADAVPGPGLAQCTCQA